MTFSDEYLRETRSILSILDHSDIEQVAIKLAKVRDRGGRLFILGVGGSAGTASHAVNDFRKICCFETYTPTDNVSELTARVNDDGWDTSYSAWLEGSKLNVNDGVLVLSVGGGSQAKNVSMNLVKSLELAKTMQATIVGIVGKDGGYTKQVANACVIIPPLFDDKITPHTEGLCSVILHLLVSHPALKVTATKWESTK
jgi:D-sedoheptulose 7-phosphate isomerase